VTLQTTLTQLGFSIPRLSFDDVLARFTDSRILVTGATGFLGRHLTALLKAIGCQQVTAVGGPDAEAELDGYDLRDPNEVYDLMSLGRFDHVFHLAGYNGGIQFNLDNPFDIFADNTLVGVNILEGCRRYGVKKVVGVVASCAYPAEEPYLDWEDRIDSRPRDIMRERDFLDGPPHHSVACHGYAKRNLQLACSYARRQYGLSAVCACPTTLYGPGDSYEPARTKVMGGMVKRFVDAVDLGLDAVTVWGTGAPRREFLYAPDCARLLVETMLAYEDSDVPLNLGTGQELSVRELAEAVADLAGVVEACR
jgi:GDP-L-fucose synthase